MRDWRCGMRFVYVVGITLLHQTQLVFTWDSVCLKKSLQRPNRTDYQMYPFFGRMHHQEGPERGPFQYDWP